MQHILKKIFILLILFLFTSYNPVLAETVVVALGDSLTEGFGVLKEEAFPNLLEQKLRANGHDVKIINAGVSGSTSASAPNRLKWYIRLQPDIVILALGGNDGLRGLSVDHMKKSLSKTIELAQSNNIRVLLAGMKIPSNYGVKYTTAFENAFFELAKKHKTALIPFFLKNIAAKTELNQADAIHPNPEGHKILAQTVLKHLEPMLPKPKQ